MSRPLQCLTLVMSVAAFAASAHAAGGPIAACSLVLEPRDLGGSYVVEAKLEHPKVSTDDPLGSTTAGCVTILERPITAKGLQEGPLEIVSSADVYLDDAHAKAALDKAHSLIPENYAGLPVDFGLADGAREWVRQDSSGVGTVLAYLLVWRERNVDESIFVVGRVGVVSAASLAPLARSQEKRVRAGLASLSGR